MPQYAILRFSKQKGGSQGRLESHHERKKETYKSNPDIDTTRSHLNFHIIQPIKSYKQEIDGRITEAGRKTRKDSVKFIDTLITASPEFFKSKKRDYIRDYFDRATEFIARKIGKDNIFTAVVHLDEKTPHMHLCFAPITADGRLSAKDIIGNKAQLVKWQDAFWKHMVKAYPDLERGQSASVTGRRHIPMRIFKQAADLTRQAKKATALLDEINPLNAKSKRDEVLELLQKLFPKMEDFRTVTEKYKREFDRLEKENAELDKKAKAAGANKIAREMEIGGLKSQLAEINKFVDTIPEDMLRQLRQAQKYQGKGVGRYEQGG